MAIEHQVPSPVAKVGKPGWLEVDPRFIASIWNLPPTGEVRIVQVDGKPKIHVGVRHPVVAEPGQVLVSHVQSAIVPIGVEPKADWERRTGGG